MRYVRIDFQTNYFSEDEPFYHIIGFRLNQSDGFIDDAKDKADEEGIFDELCEEFENRVEATFDFSTSGYEEVFAGGVYELDESHVEDFKICVDFLRDWFAASSCNPGELIHTFGSYDSAIAEFNATL
jgi:hypothetical protein